MGRTTRLDVAGGLYHVRGRVARAEPLFGNPTEAAAWVEVTSEVVLRDALHILAWCLLPDRYHLAVRTTRTPLARSMRQLHGRFAQSSNRRRGLSGPLWRGRYDACLVESVGHAADLIAWVHLRPITAGAATEPSAWPWSGHAELAGAGSPRLVDTRAARDVIGRAEDTPGGDYRERIARVAGAAWAALTIPELPWWTHSAAASGQSLRGVVSGVSAEVLVGHVCQILGVDRGRLAGRTRDRRIARCREMLATLALERLGIRSADLAAELGLHPDWVCHLASRGARRRAEEPGYTALLDELERGLAVGGERARPGPETDSRDSDWAVWM